MAKRFLFSLAGMKQAAIALLLALLVGCSSNAAAPVTPSMKTQDQATAHSPSSRPYHAWGFYNLTFNSDHTRCVVVPVHSANFHLNALKFLEDGPCTSCLSVVKITPQGDGIIDVDIQIRHPYQNLAYSAFDVKGIIMFNGSLLMKPTHLWEAYPEEKWVYLPWWRLGDWELLNPDGWTFRWSPQWNPEGVYSIEKYWPGKLSNGTPTSGLNAFRNFYTDEARHLFRACGLVERTYRIQTQPGPMTVGYAIEACWEPPLNNPVTNPLAEFPSSANQEEPYQFSVSILDGETVTNPDVLYDWPEAIKLHIKQWGPMTVTKAALWITNTSYNEGDKLMWAYGDAPIKKCSDDPEVYCGMHISVGGPSPKPPGWYRTIWEVYYGEGWMGWFDHTFTVTDFLLDY